MELQKGQSVRLISRIDLLKLFEDKIYFSQEDRLDYAIILGGKIGKVTHTHNDGYFILQLAGDNDTWKLPNESIKSII